MPPVKGRLEGATQPNTVQIGPYTAPTDSEGNFGPVDVSNGEYDIRVNSQGPSGVDPPSVRIRNRPVNIDPLRAPNYVK